MVSPESGLLLALPPDTIPLDKPVTIDAPRAELLIAADTRGWLPLSKGALSR